MKPIIFLLMLLVSLFVLADARFVEAPAECHFPYDNGNVNNEFKLSSCTGVLKTYGGMADAFARVTHTDLPRGSFIIDGQDVWDVDTYPGGSVRIQTTGADSGTDCTVISADGTKYAALEWTADITITRGVNRPSIDVYYKLSCTRGVQVE